MKEPQFELSSLLLVMTLALAVPILLARLRRVRIPVVVGEILAGIAIGQSGLGWVRVDSGLEFLMFLGLAYLMFLSGLEIDFGLLVRTGGAVTGPTAADAAAPRSQAPNPLLLGLVFLGLTWTGAYAFSLLAARWGLAHSPLLLSLIITTTSLTVVVPVLKEHELLDDPFGQTLLTAAVVADFLTMLLISVAVAMFRGGLSLDILLILVLVLAVFALYRFGLLFRRSQRLRALFAELAHGTTQLGVRASFALMVLFLALANHLGAEVILGAFLAGVLVSLLIGSRREELLHKLDAVGFGFLIPIFFILIGVGFDIRVLLTDPSALLFVPLLFAVTYIVKGAPALLLRLYYPWRHTLAGAALLTTQMSVTVAAASVGLRVGAISEAVHTAIVLVAILTSVLSPVLFSRLFPGTEHEPTKGRVLIVGGTRHALLLGQRLQRLGYAVTLVDNDPRKHREAAAAGLELVLADAQSPQLLRSLGAPDSLAVIALTGSDQVNLEVARLARRRLDHPRVFALFQNSEPMELARKEGIVAVNPQLAAISLLDNLIRHPVSTQLLEEEDGDIRVDDVRLENPSLTGKPLRYLPMPGSVLIFAVERNGERLIPNGDTVLQQGDVLTVVGTAAALTAFRRAATRRRAASPNPEQE